MKILDFFLFLWVIFALLDPKACLQRLLGEDAQPLLRHLLHQDRVVALCRHRGMGQAQESTEPKFIKKTSFLQLINNKIIFLHFLWQTDSSGIFLKLRPKDQKLDQ